MIIRLYKKNILICFLIIISIFLYRSWLSYNQTELHYKLERNSLVTTNPPLIKIIWWKEHLDYEEIRECGIYKCHFTFDRSIVNEANAILFYGSSIRPSDFPLPRLSHHIWALYHEESPKNNPFLQYENVLKYFNYTATFSRYSDFPLTTQYINDCDILRTRRYLIPISEKSRLRQTLAPVVFLQSICETLSGRNDYVDELMKYIPVDSYGSCLHNKDLPESLSDPKSYLDTIESDELFHFLAKYKFVIAYENGICNDYITEKLWRPLIIGSIPIYFGSPTVRDWLPNNKSAILISDFNSPKELADFIKYLDENDTEYNKYLDHKYSRNNPISNNLLKNTILYNRLLKRELAYSGFECFLCDKLHNLKNNESVHATGNHYSCSDHINFPEKMNKPAYLEDFVNTGKCFAESLNRLFTYNVNYSFEELRNELTYDVKNKVCKTLFTVYLQQ